MHPPSQNAVCTRRPTVHFLPTEILSIIFLLIAESWYDKNRLPLMLVCWHWYDIVLSTPGIPSVLRIRKSTTVELVRAAIQGTRWHLYVTINIHGEGIGHDFSPDAFDACFMAAIDAASRWRNLLIYSLPRPGRCKAFLKVPPLKNLEYFCLFPGCDLGSFFEPLMIAITTTATPHLRNINLQNLDAVLYLVQPECLHVFRSLTTLSIWLSKRMERPANILPHLQSLERFSARHLYLPIYPPDAPLRLIQTLRYLSLKSVSVQWIAGRVFPVLRRCFITFPHQIDAICLEPVTMPACTSLAYVSNDLSPLRYFHDLPLADLTATTGQWNVKRGNLQLITICDMAVPHAKSLTSLNLHVRCSERLLIGMLSLLPGLKVLYLRLASPCALNVTFFQAFVATKSNAGSPCEMGALPNLPLCLKLVELKVNYKRWLRDPERTALLLVLGDIVSSRGSEERFQLHLILDDLAQDWFVWRYVESTNQVADDDLVVIGISSPRGIIPLGIYVDGPLMEVPFEEAEYLVTFDQLSIKCLLPLHRLVELRVRGEGDLLSSEPPPNLPLSHTLKTFEATNIHPSFLAGQTFHQLERCRMTSYGEGPKLSQDRVTQMPFCTRLDVEDLILLANLKLPKICELGLSFDPPRALESGALQALLSMGDLPPEGGPSSRQ